MNSKERFHRTVERGDVDRPATWLGMPTPQALPGLFRYFQVSDLPGLKQRLGDDLWPVDVPYDHPPAHHIACAFDFARDSDVRYEERTLTTPGFFADATDPARVEQFDWPDPAHHMNAEACRRAVAPVPQTQAALGVLWSAHFQDACAAFGLKVMHHSCGATRDILPDLIEAGADILHPMQPLAAGMAPDGLARDFGNKVSFCGGVDAQHLLVHGTPDGVRSAVGELRNLFPTGLVISPSHEAILPDTRPENLAALFDAAQSG